MYPGTPFNSSGFPTSRYCIVFSLPSYNVKHELIEVRHRVHPSIEPELRGSSSELMNHLTRVLIPHPKYTKTDSNPYTTLEILLCIGSVELDECAAFNVENLEALIAASMKG